MSELPYDPSWNGYIVGSDEAGYGAWAGPLFVAVVVVPVRWTPRVKIGDSKTMTPAARARAFDALVVDPDILFFKMREASAEEIDEKGVYNILLQLHGECIQAGLAAAKVSSEAIAIVDGTLNIPGAHCLPKADALVPAVSAASILAKVIRDRAMIDADELYPGYGFAKHKGYGVPQHQAALERLGPCALHRRSYEPVAKIIREQIVDEPVTSWEVLIKEDPL